MKLTEAYQILNLPNTATPEEAKKQYRKLAKEFHPDVNKSPDAEDKFKKINQAYEVIEKGESPEPSDVDWNSHFNRNRHTYDPFRNPFTNNQRQYYSSNISLQTTISFKESVQGCKKEIQYSRQVKCPYCQGSGNKPVNNGCKTCGGRGQTTIKKQGAIFISTCNDCHGKVSSTPCTDCSSKGVVEANASVHVSIPSFVQDGNILRLSNMGNFSGSLLGLQDQYTDVMLHIKVEPLEGMYLQGHDIVSEVNISLLESFRGCTRMIQTIDGDRLLDIPKLIKNKEEVILSVGDHNDINHRIVINVGYPTNIDKLIDVLLEEGQ